MHVALLRFQSTGQRALCAGVDWFTLKRLETGGFEVEFPVSDYVPQIRSQLDERYPTAKWEYNECKQQEMTLKVVRPGPPLPSGRHRLKVPRCKLVVQLGDRRLWVNDIKHPSTSQQHVGAWIDTDLCVIYRLAQQSLQQQQQQQQDVPPTSNTSEI